MNTCMIFAIQINYFKYYKINNYKNIKKVKNAVTALNIKSNKYFNKINKKKLFRFLNLI